MESQPYEGKIIHSGKNKIKDILYCIDNLVYFKYEKIWHRK